MLRHAPRLAHGWLLAVANEVPARVVSGFIRPAVRAVPSSMASRLGLCRIQMLPFAAPDAASQWTFDKSGLEVRVTTTGCEEHDIALELLLCLGQALWEKLSAGELAAYWKLLNDEILDQVPGEIDEQALDAKRSLLAGSGELQNYGRASFAGTAAEFVHSLWHNVTVRTGPDYLPAPQLRRRLELLARWFPPDRGHRLFPRPVANGMIILGV